LVEPAALTLLPGHDVHAPLPGAAENWLTGHRVHWPLAHTLPAAQLEQAVQAAAVVKPVAE
jgi:hypothetical protein